MSDALKHTPTPVPGRNCGSCTACCVTLRIDTPELKKPANTICVNCTGSGCAIYEERFPVCRDYLCVWREAAFLGEEWRPDISGLLLFWVPVEGYAKPFGIDLVLADGENSLRRPFLPAFVARQVAEHRAVFMTINDIRALLNPYLESIVPLGEEAVRQQLLRFYAGATTHKHLRVLPP